MALFAVDPLGLFGDLFVFAILTAGCDAVGLLQDLSARQTAHEEHFALCANTHANLFYLSLEVTVFIQKLQAVFQNEGINYLSICCYTTTQTSLATLDMTKSASIQHLFHSTLSFLKIIEVVRLIQGFFTTEAAAVHLSRK